MKRFFLTALFALLLSAAYAETADVPTGLPADSIARVGNQVITFSQVNTELNSAAVVGLSAPVLGSVERNKAMLGLMDKAISVNLLYLDALRLGKDNDPRYQEDLRAFSDGVLSGLYRRQHLVGRIEVTPREIDAFFRENFTAQTELTDRLRLNIEALIRKEKLSERRATNRERLRAGLQIEIQSGELDPADDTLRHDEQVVAAYGDRSITWGEVKGRLTTLNHSLDLAHRLDALNEVIDGELMVRKARAAGLEEDPVYRSRIAEFRKTRLVNQHRDDLIRGMEPAQEEVTAFYEKNQERIAFRERRKILMVVLPSEKQAAEVKRRIDAGEITVYEAAAEYSIDPNAKRTLGDFGWVDKGSGFPQLDSATFALGLDELGGPVESPAGWHLIKVVDVRYPRFNDISEEETRKAARRLLLKEKLNQYVADLRRNEFPVVVYQENLQRLFREEAQWIAAESKEMAAHPERAQEIADKMRRLVE